MDIPNIRKRLREQGESYENIDAYIAEVLDEERRRREEEAYERRCDEPTDLV